MTIFRCRKKSAEEPDADVEKDTVVFRISNSGGKTIHVMTELWCEEFDLKPGYILEGKAKVSELQDPWNPLNFELFHEDEHISLWCPPSSEFQIIEKSE